MEAVLTKPANMKRIDIGAYLEISKVEVSLDVKKALFDRYDEMRPEGIDITDEEIQEMVNEVRYGNQ